MENNLIEKFKYLPDELVHIIVNFTDKLVFRHGKYLNRLHKDDERYRMVTKIPRPINVGSNKVLLRLADRDFKGYFLRYNISEKSIRVNVLFFRKNIDNQYYEFKSNHSYLFDANNKWFKIINYIM